MASSQARPATVKAVPAPVAVQTLQETCHAMYPTQPDLEDACLQRWTVGSQMSGITHPTDPPHGTGLTPEEVRANCARLVGVGSREFAACLDRWSPVMTARPPSAVKTTTIAPVSPPLQPARPAAKDAIDTIVYGCASVAGIDPHGTINTSQFLALTSCVDRWIGR